MEAGNLIAEPGKQEITGTRVLDAPRELVFRVMNDPNLIPQWWGPEKYATTVEKMELRPGGQWRFVQRGPDGDEHAFHGVYHDVRAPEQVVYTFEYEGTPGHVLLETMTFEELEGGRTRLIDSMVFQSVEDRDGMLAAGMEDGGDESMERLEALLRRVKAGRDG